MSEGMGDDMASLRGFMFERVYRNPVAKGEESKARDILKKLYCYYTEHVNELPADQVMLSAREGVERVVCDYIAGMTDHFAVSEFARIFVPKGWEIL
jgi:dGTPase